MSVRAYRAWAWALGVWLGLLLAGAVPMVMAQAAPAEQGTQDSDPTAVPDQVLGFLQQIQKAARTLDYAGTYVYQQAGNLQAHYLIHLVDGTGERQRFEALDGPPRECLRHNGVEQCLQPEDKTLSIRTARSDHFPGLLLNDGLTLENHYDWKPSVHPYRVAGRDCRVSELNARDTLRYSYRLCTDLKTHLLLRVQTLAPDGRLVEQAAFSSLQIGADVSPTGLESPWNTRNWHLYTDTSQPTDLSAQGWRFALPAGFQPIAELSRPLGPDHQVQQLVLSDGLAAISIFIETFDPKRDQNIRQGSMRQGAVNIYRMRLASWWLTVVGAVPAQTVHDLAQAIQYVPQATQ